MAHTEPRDPSGGWGKLRLGQPYSIIAFDVDRALANAGLGTHEQSFLQAVRESSWGAATRKGKKGQEWPDAIVCHVKVRELAKVLDVPHQRLFEARDRLIAAKILIEFPDGFIINKNADQWLDPATRRPLLTPAKLTYAASAREQSAARPSVTGATPGRCTKSRPSVPPRHAPACHPARPSVTLDASIITPQRATTARPSVPSHIEPACAPAPGIQKINPEKFEENALERSSINLPETGPQTPNAALIDPSEAVPAPTPPRPAAPPAPGPAEGTAGVQALEDWARVEVRRSTGDEIFADDYARQVGSWLVEGYTPAAIRDATLKAGRKNVKVIGFIAYASRVLADPHSRPKASPAFPIPSPQPEYHRARTHSPEFEKLRADFLERRRRENHEARARRDAELAEGAARREAELRSLAETDPIAARQLEQLERSRANARAAAMSPGLTDAGSAAEAALRRLGISGPHPRTDREAGGPA